MNRRLALITLLLAMVWGCTRVLVPFMIHAPPLHCHDWLVAEHCHNH